MPTYTEIPTKEGMVRVDLDKYPMIKAMWSEQETFSARFSPRMPLPPTAGLEGTFDFSVMSPQEFLDLKDVG